MSSIEQFEQRGRGANRQQRLRVTMNQRALLRGESSIPSKHYAGRQPSQSERVAANLTKFEAKLKVRNNAWELQRAEVQAGLDAVAAALTAEVATLNPNDAAILEAEAAEAGQQPKSLPELAQDLVTYLKEQADKYRIDLPPSFARNLALLSGSGAVFVTQVACSLFQLFTPVEAKPSSTETKVPPTIQPTNTQVEFTKTPPPTATSTRTHSPATSTFQSPSPTWDTLFKTPTVGLTSEKTAQPTGEKTPVPNGENFLPDPSQMSVNLPAGYESYDGDWNTGGKCPDITKELKMCAWQTIPHKDQAGNSAKLYLPEISINTRMLQMRITGENGIRAVQEPNMPPGQKFIENVLPKKGLVGPHRLIFKISNSTNLEGFGEDYFTTFYPNGVPESFIKTGSTKDLIPFRDGFIAPAYDILPVNDSVSNQ